MLGLVFAGEYLSVTLLLMKFGAHCSTSGGIWKALERCAAIGGETCQIFVKNNMQWFGKPHAPNDLALYANQLASQKFSCVFGHTGYLINLGAPGSAIHVRLVQDNNQFVTIVRTQPFPGLTKDGSLNRPH